ncbi:MAG: hypothetical protein ACRDOI_22170 [Trebonia sp.]
MGSSSARHELVCAIVQRYPDAVLALAEAAGVPLPEHDQVEEVPDMSMVGEALQPDMFERLRELESFREYEARVEAKAKAEAEREVAKTVAAQRAADAVRTTADAARAAADAARAAAEARAQGKVETRADDLIEFLSLHGGIPSDHALAQIRACTDSVVLGIWLRRAYQGETAADIFPGT